MRRIRFIILALLILCLALIFASCDLARGTVTPDGTASEPLTESDGAEIVNAPDFDISGTALSAAVSNSTETFSFINRITVSPEATWQVSTDLQGVNVIPTKTVSLNVGDNVFYILVTSGDGEGISLYTVTVRRKPTYTVSFQTNGGDAVDPVQVEEGALIAPPADPVRLCYEFAGWDADLSAPVTGNMTVKAKWTLAGHTWKNEYTIDVQAGCTRAGSKSYHCSVCNEKDPASVVEIPAGHKWDEGLVTSAATCTRTGSKLFTCTVCGKSRTDTIEKTEHRWKTEYTVDTAAGHTTAGSKSIRCLDCNAQKPGSSVTIPAEGHIPELEYEILVPPSCISEGTEARYCAKCREIIDSTIRTIPRDPDAHHVVEWNVTKQATLFEDGVRSGQCIVCDTIVSGNYSSIVEVKYTTSQRSGKEVAQTAIYREILNGGKKHFYPTEANPDGLDLFVEYSILWNPTLNNLSSTGGDPIISMRIGGSNDTGLCSDLIWMSLKDSASGSDCIFAGGYEYGSLRTVEVGPATMSIPVPSNKTFNCWPNIGGAVQADYDDLDNGHEWGWHRVGVRMHQELLNEDALKADTNYGATAPQYLVWIECYIDGTLIFKLSNAESDVNGSSTYRTENLLFTAMSDGEGGVYYSDVSDAKYVMGIRCPVKAANSNGAYLVYCDYSATAGTGFKQNVVKVDNPADNVYTTADGAEIPAKIWYRLAD